MLYKRDENGRPHVTPYGWIGLAMLAVVLFASAAVWISQGGPSNLPPQPIDDPTPVAPTAEAVGDCAPAADRGQARWQLSDGWDAVLTNDCSVDAPDDAAINRAYEYLREYGRNLQLGDSVDLMGWTLSIEEHIPGGGGVVGKGTELPEGGPTTEGFHCPWFLCPKSEAATHVAASLGKCLGEPWCHLQSGTCKRECGCDQIDSCIDAKPQESGELDSHHPWCCWGIGGKCDLNSKQCCHITSGNCPGVADGPDDAYQQCVQDCERADPENARNCAGACAGEGPAPVADKPSGCPTEALCGEPPQGWIDKTRASLDDYVQSGDLGSWHFPPACDYNEIPWCLEIGEHTHPLTHSEAHAFHAALQVDDAIGRGEVGLSPDDFCQRILGWPSCLIFKHGCCQCSDPCKQVSEPAAKP